jgi:MOSC domain-containing protein YiiM
MAELTARFPRPGRLEWIGLRPARREPVEAVAEAEIGEHGLLGDHAPGGRRAVTLIQAEHLAVVAALTGAPVSPDALRRNLVVSGLNLAALRHRRLRIGAATVEITGPCPPCSRMEEALGTGGYNAVRGHGGWYAAVVGRGALRVGCEARPSR